MAVQTRLSSPVLDQWRRRFDQTWRIFFARGDLSTLVIAMALIIIPALSLDVVGWPVAMRVLIPISVLSVLFGFVLARSQYNELIALFLCGVYGMGFVLLAAALNEPGGLGSGVYSVFQRILAWASAAVRGGVNQDELIFTLFVAELFWFLGYNSVWHIFRIDRVWRAVMPPGLILIMNTIYYTGQEYIEGYIVAYMFLCLLLIMRSNLDAREWDWYVNGIRVPRTLRRQFFRIGTVLAVIILVAAWMIPSGNLQEQLNRFQEFLQSDPFVEFSEVWNRLFSTVETQGPATADYYGGDTLELGGAIKLGDQTVLLVAAPPGRRYYWRSRVFDTYEAGRWSPAADTRLTDPETPLDIVNMSYIEGARVAVQQQFTIGLSASRLIYTAPQPQRVNLPTRTDLRYAPDQSMNISVIRPINTLRRGESYTATSLMSSADAAQLNAASTEYPQWINELYFYVSPSISDRTIALGASIVETAGATTPYEKAKAIETWLRANITYNESIVGPPEDQDPVDWVLFDGREGYCNYYASAMIIMLRSQGVPARMAAGFSQGTWDATNSVFVVQERDAHTWVEVYFPGYGWVEFEPTASQAPLNRSDNTQVAQAPTPTPVATSTPTNTPTPSITPTGGAQDSPPAEGFALPSPTPTATATPTPTPVIIPTQAPPLREQQQSSSFILTAVAFALGTLLLIALLIAVLIFIWWWWEWRGMGGLSPISRAYARLEKYMGLIGIRFGENVTPDERRRRIVREVPVIEPPVKAITQMYTEERYGASKSDKSTYGNLPDKAWDEARRGILRRYLGRLFPFLRR